MPVQTTMLERENEAALRRHGSPSLADKARANAVYKLPRDILARTVALVSPPPRLKPSQWVEQFGRLPPEENSEPGRVRFSRMPHQIAMMDDPVEPGVREIFWQMASQVAGKTACIGWLMEYVITQQRRSILMGKPTIKLGSDWMRDKFLPMVDATPCMEGLLIEPRKRGSRSTASNRRYPGGSLKVVGAKSPSTFRGSTVPVVFQDEIDAYMPTKEGDPCILMDRTCETYSDAWKIKASTATLEGASRINVGYLSGDQQKYFVPCPCCGHMQHLVTENLKFSFTAEEYGRFAASAECRLHSAELKTEGKNEDEKADKAASAADAAPGIVAVPGAVDQGISGTPQPGREDMAVKAAEPSPSVPLPPGEGRTEQEIFNNFTWQVGDFPIRDTKRSMYVCEECHRGWSDAQRIAAYLSGHPDNPAVQVLGYANVDLTGLSSAELGIQSAELKTKTPEIRLSTPHSPLRTSLRAEWRATAPFNGIRSRHLNGMYKTMGLKPGYVNYLHEFAEKFLDAKHGGRETLMAWTNMFKNEPFEESGDKMDWQTLLERAENYGPDLVPMVVFIGSSMDIQQDRVEILVGGRGDAEETWMLDKRVIYGDFDNPDMQERVEAYLQDTRFLHPVLGPMRIEFCAIDSGHQTKEKAVYKFCKKHKWINYWAVRGVDQAQGVPVVPRKVAQYSITRYHLNVDFYKSLIFGRLANTEHGPRYIHFPKQEVEYMRDGVKKKAATPFDARFFIGVCSEYRAKERQRNGTYIFRWKLRSSSIRNENLDLLDYLYGGFEIAKRDEWVARKWAEVKKVLELGVQNAELAEGEPSSVPPGGTPSPAGEGKKEYILHPPKTLPPKPKPPQKFRRPGGMFNPLKLALTFCFLHLFY